MKRFILAMVALMCVTCGFAQTKSVMKFEGEFIIGASTPLGGYHGGDSRIGGGPLGLNLRYNFSGTPWDCGILLQLDCVHRHYNPNSYHNRNNRTLTLAATGGYNFRQGQMINPFASMAIGVGHNDIVGEGGWDLGVGNSMSFIPKIGVELCYFFRIGAQCNISRKGFNGASLTLGLVLGGWANKKKP